MTLRRALGVGIDGLVGTAVAGACRQRGIAVNGTSRRGRDSAMHLDLRDLDFGPLESHRFDAAFLCAGMADMRACQADPAGTRHVNVTGTVRLLEWLSDRGVPAVFMSSSQVFDGERPAPDESSPTVPKNEYGRQKESVERAVVGRLPVAVLRLSKVLADRPVGMFKGWSEALRRGEEIAAAANLSLSPIAVADVAEAALRLAFSRRDGLWHLSARDEIAYVDAARLLADAQALPGDVVRPQVLTEEQVPAIYRHRFTTLCSRKIEREIGIRLHSSRAVLESLFAAHRRHPSET